MARTGEQAVEEHRHDGTVETVHGRHVGHQRVCHSLWDGDDSDRQSTHNIVSEILRLVSTIHKFAVRSHLFKKPMMGSGLSTVQQRLDGSSSS